MPSARFVHTIINLVVFPFFCEFFTHTVHVSIFANFSRYRSLLWRASYSVERKPIVEISTPSFSIQRKNQFSLEYPFFILIVFAPVRGRDSGYNAKLFVGIVAVNVISAKLHILSIVRNIRSNWTLNGERRKAQALSVELRDRLKIGESAQNFFNLASVRQPSE